MNVVGPVAQVVGGKLEKALVLGALHDVTELVYDLENLEYISSAGLRILITSLKEMKAKNGSMTLINVSEGVREILDLTGFGLILDIQ